MDKNPMKVQAENTIDDFDERLLKSMDATVENALYNVLGSHYMAREWIEEYKKMVIGVNNQHKK